MDYFSVLYPAVAALGPNNPQTRAAIYNRARRIVTDRVADSAADNTRLSNELLALEKTIQRIEKEFSRKASSKIGGRRSAFVGLMQSLLWPPRTHTPDLGQRSDLIWKSAAALSVILAIAICGGIGLSYWTKIKSKPAPDADDISSRIKADANVEDPGPGADQRPYTLRRQLVYYRTTFPPGALVISKSQKFLYLIRPNVVALRYSIGISRKCADSTGLYQISDKEEFPGWNDPAPSGQIDLLTRNANPLGARALYFERDERRIHGVSKAVGAGSALSCFQLINEDIIDLFDRVPVGTRVVAAN
jgi:lipoprotein-anchoring transpeptidase ErfK/SrfK